MSEHPETPPTQSGTLERGNKRKVCLDCQRNRVELGKSIAGLTRDITGMSALLDQVDADRRDVRFRVMFLEVCVIGLAAAWLLRRQLDGGTGGT